MLSHISHHLLQLFAGFTKVRSIYSQSYHPVTDTWESDPIASHLSFCTKGIPARSCRIHCFKKRRKTFSLGRRCPCQCGWGVGESALPRPSPTVSDGPPSLGGRGLFLGWWILRLRPAAARRMTALPEVFKFQMEMKGVFSPILVKQILLTWLYLFVRNTKTGLRSMLSHISHHHVCEVTGLAHISNIYS